MTSKLQARKPRVPRAKMLGRVQSLIGNALSCYHDDRQPDRSRLIPMLQEAFEIVVKLREVYKP